MSMAQSSTEEAAEQYGLVLAEIQAVSASCIEAKSRSYSPYSSFRVGASFLTTSGALVSGANVENAAYPVGTCAERVALGTAITTSIGGATGAVGYKRGDFKALGIATDVPKDKGYCSPCGMCRQALREFCEDSMPIFMHDSDGGFIVRTLGELLPLSFGPDMLKDTQEALANGRKE